ncbi:sugar-binding domain-containing protein [Propioniciclava sp.]|uniref:sugar-binding transcriptional regulator n=1 Tax=Propioniciclava sp. TaxID=2038686 RepID=UPI0026291778|nr:sugar-binding domain-containing protein [Propioniciclava sp.]
MNNRYEQAYQAATQYYLQGETMQSIARGLDVSRSTVSRLLAEARESGLVRISIADAAGSQSPTSRALADAFGITVHLVPVRATSSLPTRIEQVAQRAANLLADVVSDNQVIGVAWGVTMAALTRHLPRRPLSGSTIVQMNGGANQRSSGVPYIRSILQSIGDAFDSEVVLFPVPAFFDYADTKAAMWRERSVRHVLDLLSDLEIAVFGVGSLTGGIPSHVYSAGYLDDADHAALVADGVVGDICTVLLREDGTFADIEANARATGLTPTELRRVPRRLCVAADPQRSPAIVGALRAGVATDLVIDDLSARAVLRRL